MQTYIDELDLGKWPSIYPDNSPTGGGAQPRPGEEVSYASPAQLWGRTEDYTALPWVNNSSGNLQNCAKWNASASKYEWKVNPDDEDDTDLPWPLVPAVPAVADQEDLRSPGLRL